MTSAAHHDWRTWRRETRKRLLDARSALPSAVRQQATQRLVANLDLVLAEHRPRVLGIYWPIKREINLLDWASGLTGRHKLVLALPVVTAPRTPLEYWRWQPGDRVTRGIWNIPVPAERAPVEPDTVIAPLVGFAGYWRLGYGGGYFDRTLTARQPRPTAIGVGFDMMECSAFVPQPHDIPMRAVVTESQIFE